MKVLALRKQFSELFLAKSGEGASRAVSMQGVAAADGRVLCGPPEKSHFCLPTKVTFFNDIRSCRNG